MKGKLLLSLFSILAITSPGAWAIVGGPWDHLATDAFSQNNTDGIYQATVALDNGSGFVRFTSDTQQLALQDSATNSSVIDPFFGTQGTSQTISSLASRSNSVVFFEGNAYFGSTFGFVDATSGAVSGSTSGQSSLIESIESSVTSLGQSFNAAIDVSGFSENLTMSFAGKVTEKRPQVRFSATGELNLFSRPPIQFSTVGGVVVLQIAAAGTSTQSSNNVTTTTVNSVIPPTNPLDTGTGTTVNSVTTDNSSSSVPSSTSGAPLQADRTLTVRLFGGRVSNIVPISASDVALSQLISGAAGGG